MKIIEALALVALLLGVQVADARQGSLRASSVASRATSLILEESSGLLASAEAMVSDAADSAANMLSKLGHAYGRMRRQRELLERPKVCALPPRNSVDMHWKLWDSSYLRTSHPRYKAADGTYWVQQPDGTYREHADSDPDPLPVCQASLLTLLCTTRKPVVGEQVRSRGGTQWAGPDWALYDEEFATVASVDEDGDFTLKNPRGQLSGFQYRRNYVFVQAGAKALNAGDVVEYIGADYKMNNGQTLVHGDIGKVIELVPDFQAVRVQWRGHDNVEWNVKASSVRGMQEDGAKFLPKKLRGVRVLKDEGGGHFRVDNSALHATTTGLGYRRSKNITNTVPADEALAAWGSIVQGEDEGEWVKILPQASVEVGFDIIPKARDGLNQMMRTALRDLDDVIFECKVLEFRVQNSFASRSTRSLSSGSVVFHHQQTEPFRPPATGMRFFFFTHHKSGTVLSQHMATVLAQHTNSTYSNNLFCPPHDASICPTRSSNVKGVGSTIGCKANQVMLFQVINLQQVKALEASCSFRAVHIIREPAALTVSGYLYHSVDHDDIPGSTPELLSGKSVEEGLKMEAKAELRTTLPEMVAVHQRVKDNPNVLTVGMEDFKEDYHATTKRIFAFFLGSHSPLIEQLVGSVADQDVSRWSPSKLAATHHVASQAKSDEALATLSALNSIGDPDIMKVVGYNNLLGYSAH